MIEKIRGLIKDSPFLRYNLVFFAGSLAVAILNYLFYPVLGRIMEPADFGEVQALISIFTQGAIFLTVLSFVTIHATVNITDENERNRTIMGLERIAYIFGGIILGIVLLSTPWLKE